MMPRLSWRWGLGCFGLVCLATLTWLSRTDPWFSLAGIRAAQLSLAQVSEQEPMAVACAYFCAFVTLTALCLPGALVLLLLAGASFGLVWGSVLAVLASTVGATLTMLISRHGLRPFLVRKLGARVSRFEQQLQGNEAACLLSLRLLPVIPFVLVNVLSGVLGVRTATFFWTGLLGMLPATVAYVNAGQQLGQLQSLQDLLSPAVLGALLVLAVLPLLMQHAVRGLRRRFSPCKTDRRSCP